MSTPTFSEIAGAVARGWCHPETEDRVMDADLAYAITQEIEALLDALPQHWAIRLRKRLLLRRSSRWNAWVRDLTAQLERKP